MNNEITILLRSKDAIVRDGVYIFDATGLTLALSNINCLQVSLSSLTIPHEYVLKYCPPLEFNYTVDKFPDLVWNVFVPSFHYMTANDICEQIRKHLPESHLANLSFTYSLDEKKFQLSYNKLLNFTMEKDTKDFLQFDLNAMQYGAHRKPIVLQSFKHAPYNKPLPVFIECDIVECSSVGSRMRLILGHLCYDVDYVGVTEYFPRPLIWRNCVYKPQGDTITISLRQENGFNITIDKDDTPEIVCELKFRNSYITGSM